MGALDNEIRKLQSRITVTYEEAEKILIKCEGNVDKAYYSILKRKSSSRVKIINFFLNIFKYSLIIKRKNVILVDLPFFILAFLLPIFIEPLSYGLEWFVFVAVFILVLITFSGCDVILKHPSSVDFSFEKRKVYNMEEKIKNYVYEEEVSEEEIPEEDKVIELEDGFNKISIE